MAGYSLTTVDYPKTVIINKKDSIVTSFENKESRGVVINQVLPFRIRFTNTVLESTGYGPGNPAPIGIAIIGYNNYIL